VTGARLDALRSRLDERLLVTNLVNILYLTGFESSNAALLVDPGGATELFTDFRYIETAEALDGVEAVETKRAVLRDLAERLNGRVAFEADAMPFAQYEVLRSGGIELVPLSGLVESLRVVKDEDELEGLRRAALAADRAFEALTAEPWIGHSERELAWRLHQLLHAHGADAIAFDTLILAGPNGSHPHVEPSDRIIEERTLVVADWGAQIGHYNSDCTRTLATGDLPRELRRAYDACLGAQLAAVEGIKPGMTGAEADKLARDVIEERGYGARFGHALGHGVGLEVHEAPRLGAESKEVLEPGNVVTIEPGVYLPGLGGVRIEDLAVVNENGVELLTSFPKALTIVS
jgi:Xaa-Pro aminopeptidase